MLLLQTNFQAWLMPGSVDTYSGRLLNSLTVPDKLLMLLTSKTTNGRLV